MPKKEEHIKRAEMNEAFGNLVLAGDNKFLYWAVVAFGYSALHWIDAYLAHKLQVHPRDHYRRNNVVRQDTVLKQRVYKNYRQVMSDCRDARYEMHRFDRQEVSQTVKYLASVKSSIKKYL